MSSITLTSDEFDADIGRAEKATAEGPVFITDDGQPTHVLISFDEYRRLMLEPQNAIEADAMGALFADAATGYAVILRRKPRDAVATESPHPEERPLGRVSKDRTFRSKPRPSRRRFKRTGSSG